MEGCKKLSSVTQQGRVGALLVPGCRAGQVWHGWHSCCPRDTTPGTACEPSPCQRHRNVQSSLGGHQAKNLLILVMFTADIFLCKKTLQNGGLRENEGSPACEKLGLDQQSWTLCGARRLWQRASAEQGRWTCQGKAQKCLLFTGLGGWQSKRKSGHSLSRHLSPLKSHITLD